MKVFRAEFVHFIGDCTINRQNQTQLEPTYHKVSKGDSFGNHGNYTKGVLVYQYENGLTTFIMFHDYGTEVFSNIPSDCVNIPTGPSKPKVFVVVKNEFYKSSTIPRNTPVGASTDRSKAERLAQRLLDEKEKNCSYTILTVDLED